MWGDPHMTTLDGQYYSFMAAGEFTLLRVDAGRDLVQARFHPDGDSFTVVSGIAVRLGEREVVVQLDPNTSELSAFVDGDPVDRSMAHMDEGLLDLGAVLPGATRVVTIWGVDGLRVDGVVFDGRIDISVHLPEPRWDKVSGLLGNADGRPENDLVDSNGELLRPLDGDDIYAAAFVDAHRIRLEDSMFLADETGFDYHTDETGKYPVERLGIGDFSSSLADAARSLCREAGLDGDLLDPCIFDVLVSGDDTFANASAPTAPVRWPTPTCWATASRSPTSIARRSSRPSRLATSPRSDGSSLTEPTSMSVATPTASRRSSQR